MKRTLLPLSLALFALSSVVSVNAKNIPKVIYGEDNRYDVADYPDARARTQAASVAGMVEAWQLSPNPQNPLELLFPRVTHARDAGVCLDERFTSQIVLPYCSGFLVAPDVLVTAGHCVTDLDDCSRFLWAFGYENGQTSLAKKDVYRCQAIIEQELNETKFTTRDYAVIKLDRPVMDRAPLKFRKFGRPNRGTPLYVIGHPMRLPLKIADGAEVKGWNSEERETPLKTLFKRRFYLHANLDTYQGNSGSPVFNEETGLVEGILIEGAEDYVVRENDPEFCMESFRRSNSKLESEERIFRINKVPALKKL